MKNEKTEFSILLLSDIHSAESTLKSLVKKCKAMSYKPDYIISTGDHVTLYGGGQGDEELVKKAEKDITNYITILEGLCDNVIYIPGNHDTPSMFAENPPKFTEKSINLHNRGLQIASDLYLFGLGGSTTNPYSEEKDYFTYKIDDYSKVGFRGWPWTKEYTKPIFEEGEQLFGEALDKLQTQFPTDNSKIILLTHEGPFSSFTTHSVSPNSEKVKKPVYSGSMSLDKFLVNNMNRIIANIHGHTHKGKGNYKIFTTDIINVGNAEKGCGRIVIRKDESTHFEWRITKIERINY